MKSPRRPAFRRILLALAASGLAGLATTSVGTASAGADITAFDPLLAPGGRACGPPTSGQPPLLRALMLARTETSPFQPAPVKSAPGEVPLFGDLGTFTFRIGTKSASAQKYFDQGLRLAFAFNHAESQRAFQAAQKLDPACAMCFWGETLVLGPNINASMEAQAVAPARAALERALELSKTASGRERAIIEALATRYSADPKADRAPLDKAYADAMKAVAARWPGDATVQTLHAEAAMVTQPWDYWEAGGAKPKGRGAEIVSALEAALRLDPRHPGAIHYYIHAMEASTQPEKALAPARRLGALMPGAGHLVHMPAHIYFRLGLYRESLEANKVAMAVDERYFSLSPSDPNYRSGYYPHNIHFALASAQMGGDGKTALEAAAKLDAALSEERVRKYLGTQGVKAAPYTTHALFAEPEATLRLAAPAADLVLLRAHYHYARAVAFATRKDAAGAQAEIDTIVKLEKDTDFEPFRKDDVPAREIVQTARLVAQARLADAKGDLDGAAKAYEDAVFIEDTLAYNEPPHWYYPVRQSLGGVMLRQGRLDDAEKAFRDSLARVRNNGWALAGLAEVYRRKGDAKGETAARQAFARTWFGGPAPDIGRL